jgi:hypothetical protein
MIKEEALSTPELLELILLELDLHTLLVSAQRVCKSWNNTISASQSLQRALFFQADHCFNSPSNHRRPNPLLKRLFPIWFGPDSVELHSRLDSKWYTCNYSLSHPPFEELALRRASVLRGRNENPFLRDEASWKRMLVAQPPINQLGILRQVLSKGGVSSKTELKTYEENDGLRMEEFYAIVLRHSAASSINSFVVVWDFDDVSREQALRSKLARSRVDNRSVLGELVDSRCEIVLALRLSRPCVKNYTRASLGSEEFLG